MRFIPTTAVFVEKLKQQARKLKRSRAMKQSDALDRVAKAHGFNHWGHVTWCLKEAAARSAGGCTFKADFVDPATYSYTAEIDYILQLATEGQTTLVSIDTCVLFSSEDGDAWLLDVEEGRVLCLMWRGERQSYQIKEDAKQFFVEYDGLCQIGEGVFHVQVENPKIGTRSIYGYPTQDIADMIRQVQKRMAA